MVSSFLWRLKVWTIARTYLQKHKVNKMERADLLSHEWVEKAMQDERLLNYMAPMDTEMSDDIEMMVNGNLGWWWNITYARTTKEGSRLLFDLIHTVTSERIPLPTNLKNK